MIEVERENLASEETICVENCCFCRKPTSFWNREKDVACCAECAAMAMPNDIPDKQTWCRREQIAAGSDKLAELYDSNGAVKLTLHLLNVVEGVKQCQTNPKI